MKIAFATFALLFLLAPAVQAKGHAHPAAKPQVTEAPLSFDGGDALRADFLVTHPQEQTSPAGGASFSSSTAPAHALSSSSTTDIAVSSSTAQVHKGGASSTGTSTSIATTSATTTATLTAGVPGKPAAPTAAAESIYSLTHRFPTDTTRLLLGLAIALGVAGYLMTESSRVRFALSHVWG